MFRQDIGVLFDFDGVLIDTTHQLESLFYGYLEGDDSVDQHTLFNEYRTRPLDEAITFIAEKKGENYEDIKRHYQDKVDEIYSNLAIDSKIMLWLSILFNMGVRVGIVSSASRATIEKVVGKLLETSNIAFIISADDNLGDKKTGLAFREGHRRLGVRVSWAVDDTLDNLQLLGCEAIRPFHFHGDRPWQRLIDSVCEFSDELFVGDVFDFKDDLRVGDADHYESIDVQKWEALVRHKQLFNGPLICAVGESIDTVFRTNYQSYVAGSGQLFALAVVAIVTDKQGRCLLGLRSENSLQDASLWDFVPAGGISSPNISQQLESEWREELGIEFSHTVESALVLVNKRDKIVEFCVFIEIDSSHEFSNNSELKEITWFKPADIPDSRSFLLDKFIR